ncbi:peptidoglycan recognition protein family protein [Microtetraspora malaysiensis]|uniref:N-acetylmuramoyl-L-alanine amidase n=1 Tax=Microtetraspora malaysiensis TaxID=161358 RepID=A0ABW6SKI7_9ACTN
MPIDLVSRTAWGARAPRGSYTALSSTRGVKVHYTGGRVDPAIVDDHAKCVTLVKSIQNSHMDANGWMDIGYTACACPHQKVFVGRGLRHLPAANGAGLNTSHYAVLGLVGNSGLVTPSDGMLRGILDAIDWLRREGGAGREIKGHRDGYSTDCPGGPLYAWVQQGAPRPGGTSTPPTTGGSSGGSSGAPAWPGRLLAYPPLTTGADVRTWQQRMAARGWRIAVDGAYGPASRSVCEAFQAEKKLAADGIVGPATWRAAWEAPIT